jgi:hypothetical protein
MSKDELIGIIEKNRNGFLLQVIYSIEDDYIDENLSIWENVNVVMLLNFLKILKFMTPLKRVLIKFLKIQE